MEGKALNVGKNLYRQSAFFFLAVLLFLSIVFPAALAEMKFFLLLFVILLSCLSKDIPRTMSVGVLVAACVYSFVGLLGSFYGLAQGNAGALRVLTVMFVYPILFTLLASLYDGDSSKLTRLFFASAFSISIIDYTYIAGQVYFPSNYLAWFLDYLYADAAVVDNAGSYFKFTLPNVSSLIFLVPFLVCRFCCERVTVTGLILIISLAGLAFLSGRRALLVVSLVAPLIAFLITIGSVSASKSYFRIGLAVVAFLLISGLFFVFWPEHLESLLASIINFSDNPSNLERKYQFDALMDGVLESPFIGAGAGAVASYIRSEDMPWAYELYYVSLAFQYGLLGLLIYVVGVLGLILFLAWRVRFLGRKSFEFYCLSGFIAFILASATNPYIAKFDYMWVIFVPVALLNFNIVRARGSYVVR